jgi:hypothetical protein
MLSHYTQSFSEILSIVSLNTMIRINPPPPPRQLIESLTIAVADVCKNKSHKKTNSPADRVFDYAVADVAVEPALHGCIYTCLQ